MLFAFGGDIMSYLYKLKKMRRGKVEDEVLCRVLASTGREKAS